MMRTGWFRAVHVKSFEAHRTRALLGARLQLVGMVTKLSNHIRGVLKTFGLLPGSVRGRSFAERVKALTADRPDLVPIVRPMLAAWSKLREQIAAFDKIIQGQVKQSPACRLLMSVPGIGPVTVRPMSALSRTRTGSVNHAWLGRTSDSLPGNTFALRGEGAGKLRGKPSGR
jgi:transposase